jgi:hypothetical protein
MTDYDHTGRERTDAAYLEWQRKGEKIGKYISLGAQLTVVGVLVLLAAWIMSFLWPSLDRVVSYGSKVSAVGVGLTIIFFMIGLRFPEPPPLPRR